MNTAWSLHQYLTKFRVEWSDSVSRWKICSVLLKILLCLFEAIFFNENIHSGDLSIFYAYNTAVMSFFLFAAVLSLILQIYGMILDKELLHKKLILQNWIAFAELHQDTFSCYKKPKKLNCNFIVQFDRFPATFVAWKLFVTVSLSLNSWTRFYKQW